MAGVSLGTFAPPLGVSAISIGLPAISQSLHLDLTVAEWVIVAYVLVVTSLLTTFGRLGDLISAKNLYVVGFAIFTAGALACGLAQTFPLLIAGRVLQGFGGAMMFLVAAAIVVRAFPPHERGLALGINAMFVYAGLSVGPLVGAFLLHSFSWQALFLFNVPLGILGVLLAIIFIGHVRPAERRTGFDLAGAVVGSLSLFCLLLVLSRGPAWGWSSPRVLALAAATLVLGSLFVWVERHTDSPMIDLGLFENRLFSAALLSGMLAYMAIFILNLVVPFYLILGLGYDYFHAGLIYTPVPIAMLLLAPVSGSLSDRIGSRALASTGMAMIAVSFFWLSRLNGHPSYLELTLPLLLNGIGTGIFSSPNNSAVMGAVPASRVSTAAGILASTRNLGMALGTAAAAAVIAFRLPTHLSAGLGQAGAAVASYQDGFAFAGLLAAVAAVTSLVRGSAVTSRPQSAVQDQLVAG
jgi:EmrB/QacA subfamily drug resistance transporter